MSLANKDIIRSNGIKNNLDRLKIEINTADAIVIGAGAGLSTAVIEKLAYLEQVKALTEQCTSKEEFIDAVKKTFPSYSGGNYLDMTAGFFYK